MEATKYIELIEKELKPYYESDLTLKQVVYHRRRMEALLLIPLSSMLKKTRYHNNAQLPRCDGLLLLASDTPAVTGLHYLRLDGHSSVVFVLRLPRCDGLLLLASTDIRPLFLCFGVAQQPNSGYSSTVSRSSSFTQSIPPIT